MGPKTGAFALDGETLPCCSSGSRATFLDGCAGPDTGDYGRLNPSREADRQASASERVLAGDPGRSLDLGDDRVNSPTGGPRR